MNKEKQNPVSDYDALVTVLALSMNATELTQKAQALCDHYMDKISAEIFEKAFAEADGLARLELQVRAGAEALVEQNQEQH